MSTEAKKRIAWTQKKRWAAIRVAKETAKKVPAKKVTMKVVAAKKAAPKKAPAKAMKVIKEKDAAASVETAQA